MTAPVPSPSRPGRDGQPGEDFCAACGHTDCGHPDPIWSVVVIIDDPDRGGSEPGSYTRHLRDTACMRGELVAGASDFIHSGANTDA